MSSPAPQQQPAAGELVDRSEDARNPLWLIRLLDAAGGFLSFPFHNRRYDFCELQIRRDGVYIETRFVARSRGD